MTNKLFPLYLAIALSFAPGIAAFAGTSPVSEAQVSPIVFAAGTSKEDVDKQVKEIYDEAVKLYKSKDFAEAQKKFEEINLVIPDYKATVKYLDRIDKQRQAQLKRQDLQRQQELELKERRHAEDIERQEAQELKDKNDRAQKIYDQALNLYRDRQWEASRSQFESLEKAFPGFKHTHRYLQKLEILIAKNPGPKPAAVIAVVPAPVVKIPAAPAAPAGSNDTIEAQQKQAQDIAALAAKSAQLYRQISGIADDRPTTLTKEKMAKVDEILNTLKENKERLVSQMREAELKRQQEELKVRQAQEQARQDEIRAEQEKLKDASERKYQEAQKYFGLHEYEKAKIKFLELENINPNYKDTRSCLSFIEEYQKQESVKEATAREQKEAELLKQLQDKEKADKLLRIQQEQQEQRDREIQEHNRELQEQQEEHDRAVKEERDREAQEQVDLQNLAQKASDINDDIIRLSHQQDYEAMTGKFTELENTVTALSTLKDKIAREKQQRAQEQRAAQISAQERRNRIIEYHLVKGSTDVEHFKRIEVMQEQNVLYDEAVDRYEHRKYTQAKLLFDELAEQNDHRAEFWLARVDRAITHELLRSKEGEERERTAFLADQIQAQRELITIQQRERQRQKQLTEEFERQKRFYEDDHLLELRKEEMLKAQVRERQSQEAKRLKLEKENEKQQEALRFHKIILKPKPKPEVKPPAPVVPKPQPVVVPVVHAPVAAVPKIVVLSPAAMADARRAKIKALADAHQQRIEERQREIERRKELRAQRQAERQARIRAQVEAREKIKEERRKEIEHQRALKLELAQAQAEKSAQEKKHREEILSQEAQEREERAKQDEILREEAQRRQELEAQERQRQAQLEAQREAVRKELEDGVEGMYQEALSLYKQGDYAAAADKFKDVQDIFPGYKNSAQYMDEARRKSLTVNSRPVSIPVASNPPSTPVSHDDSVSKALDLFDPNAK